MYLFFLPYPLLSSPLCPFSQWPFLTVPPISLEPAGFSEAFQFALQAQSSAVYKEHFKPFSSQPSTDQIVQLHSELQPQSIERN